MLASEEARARLEAVADPDWRDAPHQRARALPDHLRSVAATLLVPQDLTLPWDEQDAREAAFAAASEALDELGDDDRLAVMTALHPELAPDLARWWVDGQAAPYTVGYTRRAYRAPRAPEVTRSERRHDLRYALEQVGPHHRDATWLAGWAGHIDADEYGSTFAYAQAGPLLAAAIDRQAEAGERGVLDELLAVAAGDHPIGVMDRHVVVALLRCAQPEAWEAVEGLLLAAQRQEGLRQVILEAADEGHPEAFRRIVDLVLDRDLLRFASALRAAGVWLGFEADAAQPDDTAAHVERLRNLLRDPDARTAMVADGAADEAYTALVATAMGDVFAGLDLATTALARPERDVRAATVRFLAGAAVCPAHDLLLGALADPDPIVGALAAHVLPLWSAQPDEHPDAFEHLAGLIERLPETARTADGVGVEVGPVEIDRADVAHRMLGVLGDRPFGRLIPWIPAMAPATRASFAHRAGQREQLDDDVRAVLLRFVGDRSPDVRQSAVAAMEQHSLDPAEAEGLEALLTRKTGDLRRGVITLLSSLPADEVVASAQRLWAAGGEPRRDGAAELLSTLTPRTDAATATAGAFLDDGPTERQREVLEALTGDPVAELDDQLGLYDPAERTPPTPPRPAPPGTRWATDASRRLVEAIDDVAEGHRDAALTLVSARGAEERLLADVRWLPHPVTAAPDDPDGGLVLADVFRPWWDGRPDDLRSGDDGLDALRAFAVLKASTQGRPGY